MSNTVVNRLSRIYKESPILLIFALIMVFCALYVLFVAIITDGESFKDMLFRHGEVFCTDFFQPLRNDFSVRGDIYPPLSYIWFFFMDKVVNLANSVNNNGGYIVYFIQVIVSIFLVYLVIKKNSSTNAIVITILIVISLPFLFLCERGNVLMLIIPLVIFFVYNYDSEDRTRRILSYVVLGICVGFKPYLVLLGLLVLRERNIKDICLCALIGAALFFVPFIYAGPDGFSIWLNNVISHSSDVSQVPHSEYVNLENFMMIVAIFFDRDYTSDIIPMISWIMIIPTALLVLFAKNIEKWKYVMLTILLILLFTSFKPVYAIVLMVAPLLLFMDSNPKLNPINIGLVLCLALMFIPMIETFYDLVPDRTYPISTIIESFALVLIFILLIIDYIKTVFPSIKKNILALLIHR